MKHLSGKKAGGPHTSVIDAAQAVVLFLQARSEVYKISPRMITSGLHSSRRRVRVTGITGGLLVTVLGSTTKQELYVYTRDPVATEQELHKFDSS